MKGLQSVSLLTAFLIGLCSTAASAEEGTASLEEATIVTEVLEWGETVTALRLEYRDEVDCSAIEYSNEHPGRLTYHIVNDRSVSNVYVNNSGRKDDVALHGKYVFINLNVRSLDYTTYRDQITFNTTSRNRDKLSAFYGFQSEPVVTRSGKVVAPNRFVATSEISLGADDFTTFAYTNDETGHTLYYHLYVPRGYEAGNSGTGSLPLVVHYPSGDYSYTDYNDKHRGALFSHPDALYWSSEESQAGNPAFVVTVGGARDAHWNDAFAESEMQQNYVKVIQKVMTDYSVDPSRIYAISLAGGSNAMWKTILANPDLFAAQISTAYDPYHAFKDVKQGEDNFATTLSTMPGWFFAGLTDGSGAGSLGPVLSAPRPSRHRDSRHDAQIRAYATPTHFAPCPPSSAPKGLQTHRKHCGGVVAKQLYWK